ncbi:MAG: hypothetical protein WBC44_21250 [Planctomycetaceae bacterium]
MPCSHAAVMGIPRFWKYPRRRVNMQSQWDRPTHAHPPPLATHLPPRLDPAA